MGKVKPKIVGDRRWIRYATVLFALFGFLVSAYGYYVELELGRNKNFKPLCDINESVKCSTTLSSRYATGFGFLGSVFGAGHLLNQPNTMYGMIFYALIAGLGYARNSKASLVQLNLAFISVLVSAYLAYVLIFVLDEICPVCIATYAINVVLLLLSIFKGKPRIAEGQEALIGKKQSKVKIPAGDVKPSKLTPSVSQNERSYAQTVKEKKRN